jgi:hypothetical protein
MILMKKSMECLMGRINNKTQITFSPAALASLKASTEAIEALGTKLGQIGVTALKQTVDDVDEMVKRIKPIGVSDALAALRSDLLTSFWLAEFGDAVGDVLLAYSETERDVMRAKKNNGTLVEYLKGRENNV